MIDLLTLTIMSGLVGFSFQKFQEPNMIFAFWSKWMKMLSVKRFWGKLAKPLGACIVCNSTWVGFVIGYLFTKDIFYNVKSKHI